VRLSPTLLRRHATAADAAISADSRPGCATGETGRVSLDVVDAAASALWVRRPEVPQAPTGLFLSALD
jgi:hypothetical protein